MKKYKIVWYEGYMSLKTEGQKNILKTAEVKAKSIDKVKVTNILPKHEKEKFATGIKYCLRTAWHSGDLKDATECVCDYGSYSKFIYVEEIKEEN